MKKLLIISSFILQTASATTTYTCLNHHDINALNAMNIAAPAGSTFVYNGVTWNTPDQDARHYMGGLYGIRVEKLTHGYRLICRMMTADQYGAILVNIPDSAGGCTSPYMGMGLVDVHDNCADCSVTCN